MKKVILQALELIFLFIMIFSVIQFAGYIKPQILECNEWILSKQNKIDLSEINKTLEDEENMLGCLFYNQEDLCLIAYDDLNRETQTKAIKIFGNSAILFPNVYPLTPNDTTECLISESLSKELFGDAFVKDAIVTFEKKDYFVRGVIREEGSFFVYESDKDEDQFEYMYSRQYDDVLGDETVNAFFLSHNIIGNKVVLSPREKNLQSLILKDNTYYEILYLRNLKHALDWGHIFILSVLFFICFFIILKLGFSNKLEAKKNIALSITAVLKRIVKKS